MNTYEVFEFLHSNINTQNTIERRTAASECERDKMIVLLKKESVMQRQ